MKCHEDGKLPTRRCVVEDINWAPDPRWITCPSCGEKTEMKCVEDAVLTQPQSIARATAITQARAAELDEAAEKLERLTSAATACLNYDLEHWGELDLDDWVNGAAC